MRLNEKLLTSINIPRGEVCVDLNVLSDAAEPFGLSFEWEGDGEWGSDKDIVVYQEGEWDEPLARFCNLRSAEVFFIGYCYGLEADEPLVGGSLPVECSEDGRRLLYDERGQLLAQLSDEAEGRWLSRGFSLAAARVTGQIPPPLERANKSLQDRGRHS